MHTKLLRAISAALLVLHLALSFLPAFKGMWSELYLYNAIAAAAIAVVLTAPRVNEYLAPALIATAIGFWLIGSLLSSIPTYFFIAMPTQTLSNIAYLLFYPCAILALPRMISPNRNFSLLKLFDAAIIALGLSTLGTAVFVKPLLPHAGTELGQALFALMNPIADVVFISITLASVIAYGVSKRSVTFACGALIFSITDFLYLGMHISGTYTFGSLIDDGWLLGLLVIAHSFWFQSSQSSEDRTINPIFIAVSVFLSATYLALIALRPGFLPAFILIPAISTVILAFIRMTIALKASRNIGAERILARTDELTGLPNRRKLISEIENFMGKDGSFLLLDLDGFKPVNDLHGHATGDKVLQQVATRFSRSLPYGALLARLGGDEFGVLYEGSYESAMDVALALRATLSYPFTIENVDIHIGVSIGMAANNGAPDLLRRADDAMYRAKREGLGVCRL